MEVRVRIQNLDEYTNQLENRAKRADSQVLDRWTRQIEEQARDICDDTEGGIRLRVPEGENTVECTLTKLSQFDCVIKAIESLLDSMDNPATKGYFEQSIKILTEQKKKNEESESMPV